MTINKDDIYFNYKDFVSININKKYTHLCSSLLFIDDPNIEELEKHNLFTILTNELLFKKFDDYKQQINEQISRKLFKGLLTSFIDYNYKETEYDEYRELNIKNLELLLSNTEFLTELKEEFYTKININDILKFLRTEKSYDILSKYILDFSKENKINDEILISLLVRYNSYKNTRERDAIILEKLLKHISFDKNKYVFEYIYNLKYCDAFIFLIETNKTDLHEILQNIIFSAYSISKKSFIHILEKIDKFNLNEIYSLFEILFYHDNIDIFEKFLIKIKNYKNIDRSKIEHIISNVSEFSSLYELLLKYNYVDSKKYKNIDNYIKSQDDCYDRNIFMNVCYTNNKKIIIHMSKLFKNKINYVDDILKFAKMNKCCRGYTISPETEKLLYKLHEKYNNSNKIISWFKTIK